MYKNITPFLNTIIYMPNNFNEFIELLKLKLASDMPGIKAHNIMTPERRGLYKNSTISTTESAILILLYKKNNQIYFPIIKRQIYNGHHSGQMAFPGGKFEKSDTSLIETALRETEEEIGVNQNKIKVLGVLSELLIPITNMKVLPVLGFLESEPEFSINKHEVDALFNINIIDLINPDTKNNEIWNLRGNDFNVPFYNMQNQKVWGATAMMLSEFEQIIKDCV